MTSAVYALAESKRMELLLLLPYNGLFFRIPACVIFILHQKIQKMANKDLLTGRAGEVVKALSDRKVDVACIQEN